MKAAAMMGAAALALATGGGALGLSAAGAGPEVAPPGMVTIPGGRFRPLYALSEGDEEVQVATFRLDRLPVTNQGFLAFTQANPQWRRGAPPALFVDDGYLSHWAGPAELGPAAAPRQPVTRVSWFAAKAYCEARGARLPTEMEWEYAAAASETQVDGRAEPAWQERILSWYALPTTAGLPEVGHHPPNLYGVQDLHGLIWEWVLEFNSTLVSADSRESQSADVTRFCGAGAVTASDKADYASFMRYAFRSALEARYTTGSLGFRCAADAGGPAGGGSP